MLVQIDINKHNFSKIGKYISNKLHHIHKHKSTKNLSSAPDHLAVKSSKDKLHTEIPKEYTDRSPKKRDHQWYEPSVGSYRVNYKAVDKNIHQYNFNRSTPHFFGLKYKANEITPLLKNYPDEVSPKQKGFTELGRMAGREQIKGSIRKNIQNPHEERFESHQFPTLTNRSNGVAFAKMSPRKDLLGTHRKNAAEYDCDFEIGMKRLDSHIIPFQKQTSRPQLLFQQVAASEDYRYGFEQVKQIVDKNIEWSKQLSRYADGILPSYMEKTVTSRMAISHINLKTLEMNCSEMKQNKKIQRKRIGAQDKPIIYTEVERSD